VVAGPDTRGPAVYRSVILPPAVDPKTAEGRTSPRRIPRGLALSPDGRRLAFVAPGPDGRAALWVRPLDGASAQMLAGTEGAAGPFWSPDGRQLAFVSQGRLKRIDVTGGSPVTLHEGAGLFPGTWNRDNVILFSDASGPIFRISAAGGVASRVTSLDAANGETNHLRPVFLPDARHFLYRANKGLGTGVLYAGSLDSNERTQLEQDVLGHAYANGFLLFVRGTTLMALRFDADRLKVSGEATPVLEQVRMGGALLLNGALSVSESGVLVYQHPSAQQSQLVWLDRRGKEIAVLGQPAELSYLQLSPNGRHAAVTVQASLGSNLDLWLYDTVRGGRTRITADPADETSAIWSPDSERLAFLARRPGDNDQNLYQLTLSTNTEERLLATPTLEIPTSWSPDSRFIVYQAGPPNGLWILPISGDRKPMRFAATGTGGSWAQFSPDGRWIAYASSETGRREVYIAPFQRPGRTVPISTNGGDSPRWRRDGKEIFYVIDNNTLVSVAVGGGDSTIDVGDATPLFQTRFSNTPFPYAVAADGQRFLINRPVEETTEPPITLIVNWPGALNK
jgi:eukaryotic-like serine/threonine-protein kinase